MRFVAWILLGLAGCSVSSSAHRDGREALERGRVDEAVRHLERAHEESPENIAIRIDLVNARVEAARFHRDEARRHLADGDLERAEEELERALELDPTNRYAEEELAELRQRLASGPPPPPRPVPSLPETLLSLQFEDTSLRVVLEALADLAGVNILFDEAYRDRSVSVDLDGVTFAEALDLLTSTHGLFYKVERSSAVTVRN